MTKLAQRDELERLLPIHRHNYVRANQALNGAISECHLNTPETLANMTTETIQYGNTYHNAIYALQALKHEVIQHYYMCALFKAAGIAITTDDDLNIYPTIIK
jgi:hypothetical protein